MSNLVIKKYTEEFLELSWAWLNDEEIKSLTNTPPITREGQKSWFDGLKDRRDYLVWGLEYNGEKIGACGLKNLTGTDCEYWGYIGEKKYWGLGLGRQMMTLMEEQARQRGLHSIWLKVLENNQRALRLYNKTGYVEEGKRDGLLVLRKQI